MRKEKFRKRGKEIKKGINPRSPTFELKLYIAGKEANSRKAVELIEKFCNQYLKDNCSLTIIDVFQDYQSALKDGVLVAPTLVWVRKGTPAFLIGNFDRHKLLDFFGLTETAGGEK